MRLVTARTRKKSTRANSYDPTVTRKITWIALAVIAVAALAAAGFLFVSVPARNFFPSALTCKRRRS